MAIFLLIKLMLAKLAFEANPILESKVCVIALKRLFKNFLTGIFNGGEWMKRKMLSFVLLTAFLVLAIETVAASSAFLCPVVGDGNGKGKGVLNADSRNGDNGVVAITPPVGTSQLPGKNQAGVHANPNAYNTKGPGDSTAGPGHNPDFSPIWPPS